MNENTPAATPPVFPGCNASTAYARAVARFDMADALRQGIAAAIAKRELVFQATALSFITAPTIHGQQPMQASGYASLSLTFSPTTMSNINAGTRSYYDQHEDFVSAQHTTEQRIMAQLVCELWEHYDDQRIELERQLTILLGEDPNAPDRQ